MYKRRAILFFVAVSLLLTTLSRAQSLRPYENSVTEGQLRSAIEYLSHELTQGRASGTTGKMLAERYIMDEFRKMGLVPWNWTYTQSFLFQDSLVIRNVIGLLPATRVTDEYIIIGAHYDHLGRLGHTVYPGADDNASGVAALLSIARMFVAMKADGNGPRKNLLFVAFDGKELDMAGSRYFVRNLKIPKSHITAMVNLDMLGTDLVPPHKDPDYLFALGEDSLPATYRGYLSYICSKAFHRLDLDQTFYGSSTFAKMMYRTSDQHPFVQAGIPAVLFTSAFHEHTYKKSDTPAIINYPLLRKRTLVIFNFINRLCADN